MPHFQRPPLSRRDMLAKCSTGFGLAALQGILAQETLGARMAATSTVKPPHFAARAKNVIFCFMSGGVAAMDSFDPKPRLRKEAGQPIPMKIERTMFDDNGNILPSPWTFQRAGACGNPVSDLFPHMRSVVDELAIIRSMTSTVSAHAQANYFLHTGFPNMGYPSAGAWVSYGLGREADNLPSFVSLRAGGTSIPIGGVGLVGSAFLPAENQASFINADAKEAVANILPKEGTRKQRRRLDFIRDLDAAFSGAVSGASQVESAIQNYELAYRMQAAVPEMLDLHGESAATKKLYGVDSTDKQKAGYARQCLLARRLVERGVRFVELNCNSYGIGGGGSGNPWDQHWQLEKGHGAMAQQVDQPIAALIKDLKSRGMLDETLIVWAGEFGRTPFSQGKDGRDHNPFGFSVWLAGGGVRGGAVYGATDEYGYHAVENVATIYDLWATVLHLLGLRHVELTYRHGGRDMRLTDVHGEVIRDVIV